MMTTFRTLCAKFAFAALLSLPGALPGQTAESLRTVEATQRALPRAPRLPRTAFLENRALTALQLSPAGDFVAYLREQKDSRSLWLLPTQAGGDGGDARQLVRSTQAEQMQWSRDGRWLFLRAPRSLIIVGIDGHGGVRVPLGGSERRQVMKLDPSQPAAVLLREGVAVGKDERWRVVRLDARGQRTLLREEARWIHDIALDERGRIVALARFEGDHDVLYRVLPQGSLREVLHLKPTEKLNLLAAMADGSLLMEGNPGSDAPGGNFRRVLRLTPDDTLQTIHEDPRREADLDEIELDPRTQQPLIASYRSTVAATYGIGAMQTSVSAIAGKFPGRDIDVQVGNGPSARWLVTERASTLRDPRWWLYDPRNGELRRILDNPAITAAAPREAALARKIAIDYLASDGMRVRGFLLLPPGVDAAHAPLVAHVHGGPVSHFRPGYDGVAQFLANRGYVVFQPNFRGSSGHGRDYTFAANGDFGNGRVQQDIVEGVRWLLAQGIGDADRVGIVGHSFGGYSTLLGLTFQPELFKVGVAGSPPSDLGWAMRWLVESGDQGDLPDRSLQHMLRALSLDATEPATYARLHAQSPRANASLMRRPMLIVAGGSDRTVAIREVIAYAAVLKAAKRPLNLLIEPNGGHSPVDTVPREAYLFGMETMLQKHLGGPAPEPPDQRLRAYLRENLRAAGPELAPFAKKGTK